MNNKALILVAVALLAGLCWAFPPFHIRSLKAVRAARANMRFNAADFVATFWTERLLPATEHAAEATKVLDAIKANPKEVHDQFGRSVGISSSYYLFLRGTGRVVSVSDDSIGLALKPEGDVVDVSVPLGLVFGNAVRDGTGLLSPSDYPNAQDFNDISAALDHIVETQVLPELQRIAKVGTHVQFAGCVEVGDEDEDLRPLRLLPIVVKVESAPL